MEYTSRASQQFRSQGQSNRATGQGRAKHDESDPMHLTDFEIAGCINDIGVPFTRDDLLKPQPQQIQRVFEWFAELLMNITRETVEPAMRAAAEDVCKEHVDIIPSDTRNLMGFYASLRKLLVECGINDFSFSDLLRPTHDRLVRIFSYIINFVRFRETQTATIDEHFDKTEATKSRIDTLWVENRDMEARLEEMKQEREIMESQAKQKIKRNDELKAKLLELTKGQAKVGERLDMAKSEKDRLTGVLEERTEKCIALRQESEKLRPYAQQSSAALQANLTELSENLARDKGLTEVLDKRTRALQTSADTFGVVTNDVVSCIKVLDEVANELQKEDEENLDAAKRRDALSERGNNVREVERTEALLQRQLARWIERTETTRKASGENADRATERMEGLRSLHRRLTEERGDKNKDIERRRVRIEQTEKKMADLKENIENEIHSAHDEYLKMDSHIKLYITEMEQAI
ncbi:kinetochore-associated Ndc80 complex subunit nuf2 [Lambiella insularis]|nr:kinetochore-associated Ndc80 complex subunit nuf2 [Lambiella insularis]